MESELERIRERAEKLGRDIDAWYERGLTALAICLSMLGGAAIMLAVSAMF